MNKKKSAKRDTQPLKGCDHTRKCPLWGIPKDRSMEKIWSFLKKLEGGRKEDYQRGQTKCG